MTTNSTEVRSNNEREIEMISNSAIAPGRTGQLFARVGGSCDIARLTIKEEGAEIVAVHYGRNKEIKLEEGQSFDEALANAESKSVPARAYVTVIVKNVGTEEQGFSGVLVIANEKPFENRNVKESGGNDRVRAASVITKKPSYRQATSARPRSFARVLNPPRHVDKVDEGLDMVLPADGERVLLIQKGHAEGLARFLEHRVPIHRSFKQPLIQQLMTALDRDGAVSFGGNEIAARLNKGVIQRLLATVQRRGPFPAPSDVRTILGALRGQPLGSALVRLPKEAPQVVDVQGVAAAE